MAKILKKEDEVVSFYAFGVPKTKRYKVNLR